MKVAVIFSGLIRPEKDLYKDSIWKMKTLFPNADFFYTTWKGYGEYDWMTSYYKEPKLIYNADIKSIKNNIKEFRKIKDQLDHPDYGKYKTRVKYWRKGRNLIKQHLGYTLAFEEHVTNHDIAIRVRYDLKWSNDVTFEDMDQACEFVHLSERPIGIGNIKTNQTTPGQICLCDQTSQLLADFMIIHRADKFNPQHVWDLYKNKKLGTGEHGWWQILAEPYYKEVYNGDHMWCNI